MVKIPSSARQDFTQFHQINWQIKAGRLVLKDHCAQMAPGQRIGHRSDGGQVQQVLWAVFPGQAHATGHHTKYPEGF
jgi:hypothetical protein